MNQVWIWRAAKPAISFRVSTVGVSGRTRSPAGFRRLVLIATTSVRRPGGLKAPVLDSAASPRRIAHPHFCRSRRRTTAGGRGNWPPASGTPAMRAAPLGSRSSGKKSYGPRGMHRTLDDVEQDGGDIRLVFDAREGSWAWKAQEAAGGSLVQRRRAWMTITQCR